MSSLAPCPVEFTAALVRLCATQSCGKCTPCRVGLRALEVEILDAEGKRVITHPRSYGDKPTDSGDPSSQLGLLCDRPAAWRNSRVRDAMPDPLREWIDAQDEATRRDSLRALLHADGESGWRAAVAGMLEIVLLQCLFDRFGSVFP